MNVLKFLSDSFVDYTCKMLHYAKAFPKETLGGSVLLKHV